MLGAIIQALVFFMSVGMFFYYYFVDGTVKDLLFCGVILLFQYIYICTDYYSTRS